MAADTKDGKLIALIYARVSTIQQDSESQEHRCRQRADQSGYVVEEVFPDKFTGGGDFWKRPQLKRLLNHIDRNPHKKYVVIFDDLKRFARDTEFHIRLRNEFKSRGTKVECLNFNFEDSPEGEFVETMFAAQGQLERQQNRRQVIQKMKARLERGYWTFDVPPGLKYINDPVHGKILVADEPKASIIRKALEGFADNTFPNRVDVQAFLESRGFLHRERHKYVGLEQVNRILKRVLYSPCIEYPHWGISRRKGHHQALISLETFEKIQEKLKGTAKGLARKDLNLDFPARGFVVCSGCSKPLTSSWTTKHKGREGYRKAYYRCHRAGCPERNRGIPKEALEGNLGGILGQVGATEEVLALTKEVALDAWNERHAYSKESDGQRLIEIAKLESEINIYLERITKTNTEAVIGAYEKKITELTNKKLLLEEKSSGDNQDTGINFETALETVFEYIKNPYAIWTNGIFEDKRLVLRMIFTGPLTYNRKTGFETTGFSLPTMLFRHSGASDFGLVEMAGFAPASGACGTARTTGVGDSGFLRPEARDGARTRSRRDARVRDLDPTVSRASRQDARRISL